MFNDLCDLFVKEQFSAFLNDLSVPLHDKVQLARIAHLFLIVHDGHLSTVVQHSVQPQ